MIANQTALPVEWCQRWDGRRHSWRRTSEGGFDPERYTVDTVTEAAARVFVTTHHYSRSLPAVRMSFGLFDRAEGGALVGVAVLGVPMHPAVLTNPFPALAPYRESLELSRLVLLDAVPAPAESWFCARAFRLAARRGVRGVVAHSDPVPRHRTTAAGVETVMPGHVGCVYQALGMRMLGRTTRREQVLLPDATVLTARAINKVRRGEPGAAGVERRLVALGARPRGACPAGDWLAAALDSIGARRSLHPGNYRYALPIGPRGSRPAVVGTAYPYPKRHEYGALVLIGAAA